MGANAGDSFRKQKVGERPPLKTVTKQQLVKTVGFMCAE